MNTIDVVFVGIFAAEVLIWMALKASNWLLDRKLRRLQRHNEALQAINAMMAGERVIVMVPPKGMTLAEAQLEIDTIAAVLAPKSKRAQA